MELNPEIITIFSLILNGILVGAVLLTYHLTRNQYEKVNRPWLVLCQKGMIYDNSLRWSLENIGNLPATDIMINTKYDIEDGPTHEDLGKEPIKIGIIMPKQKYDFGLPYVDIDMVSSCTAIEIVFDLRYKFLNRKKISEFTYYKHNMVDHDEVICTKAD